MKCVYVGEQAPKDEVCAAMITSQHSWLDGYFMFVSSKKLESSSFLAGSVKNLTSRYHSPIRGDSTLACRAMVRKGCVTDRAVLCIIVDNTHTITSRTCKSKFL